MTTPATPAWSYSNIKPWQFKRPYALAPDFLNILSNVVAGMGWAPTITSDARTRDEEESLSGVGGAAPNSLHVFDDFRLARAVDIRMPRLPDKSIDTVKLDSFLSSVFLWRRSFRSEIEIDISDNDPHLHLGIFDISDKRPSRVIVRKG